MRQINPTWFACAEAARRLRRSERVKVLKAKKIRDGSEYLNTEHEYNMMVGDVRGAEVFTMTGREAKTRNLSFEVDFIEALDDKNQCLKEKPRLKRFLCVEKPKAPPQPLKHVWEA